MLAIVLLAIRLPLLIKGVPLTIPEVKWLALAHSLQLGNILYVDVWDETSPLSALVYWLLFLVFGKNILAHHILSTIMIYIQALLWNDILTKRKLYEERTVLPALLYITFSTVFFDFIALSPILLANTFIILALRHIFLHINENINRSQVFDVGLYLGIATLFFLPSFVLLLIPLVGFLLFTGTKPLGYFLLLFSFFLPIIVVAVAFFLIDGEYAFLINAMGYLFYGRTLSYFDVQAGATLLVVPTLLLLTSLVVLFQSNRYINYQVRCQQAMLLTLVVSTLIFLFNASFSAHSFVIFLPVFSFFTAHYFLIIKRLLAEALFILFTSLSLTILYATLWLEVPKAYEHYNTITYDKLIVTVYNEETKQLIQGKKILVLGNNVSAYYYGKPATTYLNWQLAQRHFNALNKFDIQVNILDNFKEDLPQIIVDKKDFVPILFEAIPALAQYYNKVEGKKMYQLNYMSITEK